MARILKVCWKITLSDKQVMEYIEILLPVEDGATSQQMRNMKRLQEDMKRRYFDAPDLLDVGRMHTDLSMRSVILQTMQTHSEEPRTLKRTCL